MSEEQKEGVQMEGKSLERLFEFVNDKAAVYIWYVLHIHTHTRTTLPFLPPPTYPSQTELFCFFLFCFGFLNFFMVSLGPLTVY